MLLLFSEQARGRLTRSVRATWCPRAIGVGASKFLGVQWIFVQIIPNLHKKLSSNFFGLSFGVTSKKWSSLVFLQMLGVIFAQVFRDFA